MHAPDAFPKFDRVGVDRKDIRMIVEHVNVERHMMDWEHRCNLCDDIVPKENYTLCDSCDRYAVLHHFVGNIHFTIEDGPIGCYRVIFHAKGRDPSVPQRERIRYDFY